MKYFDTHSHLQFPQYDGDRASVIEKMRSLKVATITVGTDFETSKAAVLLSNETDNIWATVGVHPNDSEEIFDEKRFQQLLGPKVVAIGECGLDFFRSDKASDAERQKENFVRQIEFALAHDLALMLHVRPSKGTQDAHAEALALLESYALSNGEKLRGTSHFFTGSLESARRYWNIGFSISVPGVITFARDYDEIIQEAPPHLILSETDAPYAAPVPYRGKRNEPAFVVEIVRKIAELRGKTESEVGSLLVENACRTFRIAA